MRVAIIKGLICLVTVLAVFSTTVIMATDSEIEQNENQSTKSTVIVTTQSSTKVTTTKKIEETTLQTTKSETSEALYSASKFRNTGVIHWNGWRWTWYSKRVLPGGGLNIPGRHIDSNGYICDENENICLSSSSLSKGTVIATPFGKNGKVYDTGCASDTIDVYVNW